MRKTKDIPYITLLPIVILSVIAFKLIDRIDLVKSFVQYSMNLLIPIVWACVIAYLINPLMTKLEIRFKLSRGLSILFTYIAFLGILFIFLTSVTPTIVESITEIVKEVPNYISQTETMINSHVEDFEALERFISEFNISFEDLTQNSDGNTLQNMLNNIQQYAFGIIGAIFDFTSGIFKFIIGLVMSIYILKDKEKFADAIRKMGHAYFDKKRTEQFFKLMSEIDDVFSKYIIGKSIDSLIIGVICFIGMMMLDVRYGLLLSIIVAITNMIPYFGPFIGAVPAVLITIFYSPIQALWVLLFILALQQFDGYILGPKILGDSVGLSPFWIIIAILIGGGFFGVLGMLIAVPIMAVIRNLNQKYIEYRLSLKGNEDDFTNQWD